MISPICISFSPPNKSFYQNWKITDKGACKLAVAIAYNGELEDLDLSHNPISDDGLYALSATLYNNDEVNETLGSAQCFT